MKSYFQGRFDAFLEQRIPTDNQFQLDMKSIFIFPSAFGGLYLVLCVGLFLLGTNYQNNLMLLLFYFLISIFLLHLFVAYFNFSRLNIQVGKSHNIYAGEHIQLPIWLNLHPHKSQAVHGKLFIQYRKTNELTTVDLDDCHNPIHLPLKWTKRGRVKLPRLTFKNYYPLGLFKCWTHLSFRHDMLAYPKPIASNIKLIEKDADQESENGSHRTYGFDDFEGLKTYQTGEPLNHIAWKQFAKGQGLVSKQFSSGTHVMGWLTLLPCSADTVELSLSQLCYQVLELSKKNVIFGLDLGQVKIEPGNGSEHQQQCLTSLALFDWRQHES